MNKKFISLTIPLFLFFNLSAFSEENFTELEKAENVLTEFTKSQGDSFPSGIIIYGYGKQSDNIFRFGKSAAISDLEKNILGFSIGWSYKINNNEMVLNTDNKYNGKTKIAQTNLTDNITSASTQLNISENTKGYLKKLPFIIAKGKAEIKDKNFLEAYNQAKNQAINAGLKNYYGESLKGQKTGKIFLQNVIYNSLNNSDINNLTEVVYIIKFSIKDESI